jgi:hypothetical protein
VEDTADADAGNFEADAAIVDADAAIVDADAAVVDADAAIVDGAAHNGADGTPETGVNDDGGSSDDGGPSFDAFGCLLGDDSIWEGGAALFTQHAVDDFPRVREVTGTLALGVGNLPPLAITSLEPLECLRKVGGLQILNNAELTDLDGLQNLNTVEGYLSIGDNPLLQDLSALGGLTHVGVLSVSDNPSLTSLAGLEGLTSIPGFVHVWNNDALTNLTGLSGLTTIGDDGWLDITHNDQLTSLAGLDSLTTLRELRVYDSLVFSSFAGLESLTDLRELVLFNNPALSRCDAEEFANRFRILCSSHETYVCSDVCTCPGNWNEVTCGG